MDLLLAALFGLIAGGVVNVLADDLPFGRMPRLPRYPNGSRRPVRAWLGIAAFALRLRCAPSPASEKAISECKRQPLSWRLPLAEFALLALTTFTYAVAKNRLALAGQETLILLIWVALFILVAVIDLEHMRIPLPPLLACALLALLRALAFPQSPPAVASMLAGALCACLSFSLLYLGGRAFAQLVARRHHQPPELTALGRGDVYLMTVGGFNRRVSPCAGRDGVGDSAGWHRRGCIYAGEEPVRRLPTFQRHPLRAIYSGAGIWRLAFTQ